MSLLLINLFVFNYKLIKSQLCYGVSVNLTGLTGTGPILTTTVPYSCRNYPDSECLYFSKSNSIVAHILYHYIKIFHSVLITK